MTEERAEYTTIDARIAEIMSRWIASTRGEWITTADDPQSLYAGEIVAVCDQDDPEIAGLHHVLKVDDLDERPADLIFAANAHQDIPFLVSVIAESNALIRSLRSQIDQHVDEARKDGNALWKTHAKLERIQRELTNEISERDSSIRRMERQLGVRNARIAKLEAQVARLEAEAQQRFDYTPVTLLRYIVNSHPDLPVDDRIAARRWLDGLDGDA